MGRHIPDQSLPPLFSLGAFSPSFAARFPACPYLTGMSKKRNELGSGWGSFSPLPRGGGEKEEER